MTEYNIYCDESCHLENDGSSVMVLGAVILPSSKNEEIANNIRSRKARYNVKSKTELKWVKVSTKRVDLYKSLLDCFFIDDDIRYRAVIADKQHLHHEDFNQTHDDWYYKIYYTMLQHIFSTQNTYRIFIDIKDTHSYEKAALLSDICARKLHDFKHECIKSIQPIRSDEVQVMQIVDVLNGAVCRANRTDTIPPTGAKQELIEEIQKQSGKKLTLSTNYGEQKFNLFKWEGR